jgi:hypothetical protein
MLNWDMTAIIRFFLHNLELFQDAISRPFYERILRLTAL